VKTKRVTIQTHSREEIHLITRQIDEALREIAASAGLCTIFTPHTTTALTINEQADPDVRSDLIRAFRAMVPKIRFEHGEGNSDAHLLSALIGVSITVPYRNCSLLLGRWQGVYFVELDGPRERHVDVWIVE
jgi:secondary thiamine-phosphate synthase enzyme